ncbi:MAG: flagellar biosynthesis anti-sigma factor FlgM [Aquabacterium sp.]
MRISNTGLPDVPAGQGTDKVRASSSTQGAKSGFSVPASSPSAPLQSATLQPAIEAMAELPEVDQARVDALREALAKGEIRFDAGKLASLITRYHGGR